MAFEEMAVSPNYYIYRDRPNIVVDKRTKEEVPTCFDTYILVHEDAVNGWFLNQARHFALEDGHSGFVILQIVISQIEGIEQYCSGESSRGKSLDFFKKGMKRIYKLTDMDDPWLGTLYEECRCGLFHDGMTRGGIVISPDSPLFEVSQLKSNADGVPATRVVINPWKLLSVFVDFFTRYMTELKDPTNKEMREKFERTARARSLPFH